MSGPELQSKCAVTHHGHRLAAVFWVALWGTSAGYPAGPPTRESVRRAPQGFLFSSMTFHRKLFDVHRQMVRRCTEPSCPDWKNYGGRGISVCGQWGDVKAFTHWALTHGYASGLTLDRIDTNAGYSPENCRWATLLEQARNARRVVMLTVDGVTRPLVEWAEIVGISQRTMKMRIKLGWSHSDTVFVRPVKGRNQFS